MVNVKDALEHLGYDDCEDDGVIVRKVTRALKTGYAKLHGAVGEDVEKYLPDDPRIDDLVLCYTTEAYDNREGSQKQASVRSRHAHDMELQLKMELRRAKSAAAGGGA